MYLARVQNQIATTAPQAPVWSCAMVLGCGREATRPVSKQFAHRGSFSSLCARSFSLNARLGNPEDTY